MVNAENWVVKSNALIESKGNFSPLELKVILGLISEIKLEDEAFKEYELSVEKMRNAVDSGNNAFYLEIKKACEKLVSKTITIEKEIDDDNPKKLKKKKSFLITSYLSSAEYADGEHKIKLCFDPKLKPYLLELQGSFTKYQLKNILTLKSQYSIRIYELIKPMEGTSHQKRNIELKILKDILGIGINEYPRFFDFEKRILKVAEKEISENTDIVVSYEKIKKGKNVHSIEFHVTEKDYVRTDQQIYYDQVGSDKVNEIRNRAQLLNIFSDTQIVKFYEIASERTDQLEHINRFEYMTLNYYYTLSKNPKNKAAYYKKALECDYADARKNMAKQKGLI